MNVLLSWSSGKDSAWSLHEMRSAGTNVTALLTTFNSTHDRAAMHAVRRELVRAQATAAGLPLVEVELPWPCPNEVYEERMAAACAHAVGAGVTHVAFGDLFLEDVRRYREDRLAGTGLDPLFPLWGRDTRTLAGEMIDGGLCAVLTCVDPRQVSRDFAGRAFDATLLAELPAAADPCGERGEFHTFVHAGPMFTAPLDVAVGEVVERDGFAFADVTAVRSPA